MARVLIIGGGVAGPVAAMALQRAGTDAVVYDAHAPTDGEVGSYLTVATNGIDALRAIGADEGVLAAGFPTPTNMLWSGSGRRLGVVSNGGVLPDGTTAHTIKRARLYRALHQRAATRAIIDPAAPGPRYVGLVNFGGYTPDSAGAAEPGVWHMIFGRQAFFGYVVDPAGGAVWFANVPRPAVSAAERAATSDEQWRGQLLELFAADRGPASSLIAAGRLELAADNTHDLPYERLRRRRVNASSPKAPAPAAARRPARSAGSSVTSCCRSCSGSWLPTGLWRGCMTTTSTGTLPPDRPIQPCHEQRQRAEVTDLVAGGAGQVRRHGLGHGTRGITAVLQRDEAAMTRRSRQALERCAAVITGLFA
jgi:FAD binding domain